MEVLALDLGASNGRAIVGKEENGSISYHEVHRFKNEPVKLGNYLYWDFPRLFHELKTGLIKAKNQGFCVECVGVDSWGVDYGLIDIDGDLVNNPVHYRDERSEKGRQQLLTIIDEKELKIKTGMDSVSYNTVNQLLKDKNIKENVSFLNIPDLFNYLMTGIKGSEFSMATTTQLVDYDTLNWNWDLISTCGLSKDLFNEILPSGRIVGNATPEFLKQIGYTSLKVASVTSHDTASAVSSTGNEDDFLFVATGTWIIVGSSQKQMTMNDIVMEHDLSNEGGKYPNVNLLKNHVGLWILQEVKREWEKEGIETDYPDMIAAARKSTIESIIDIDDDRFYAPGDMIQKIHQYLEETNQPLPKNMGDMVLIIEQSLAKKISETLKNIEKACGKEYEDVHVFGGGVRDSLLLELIEKYAKKKVVMGEIEATTIGNVKEQLSAMKHS